jgi:hypothetical protein
VKGKQDDATAQARLLTDDAPILPPAPENGQRVRIPLAQLGDYLAVHRLRVVGGGWPAGEKAPVVLLTEA